MKLKALAVACAMACAAQAYAVTPSTTPDVQLFLSGSSALQNAIGQIHLDMCQTNTIDEMWDGTAAAPSGSNYRAYFCTFKSTATTTSGITIPASLQGKNVLLYNTAAGGSIKGINPIANALPVTRLDITTCVVTSPAKSDAITGQTQVYACPGTVTTAVPDAGVSDTEPALFTGMNLAYPASISPVSARVPAAGNAALTATQLKNLTQTTALGQPMGIVTTSNINATPGALSLSKAQISSLMSGNTLTWTTVLGTTLPSTTIGTGTTAVTYPAVDSVVVCRRQPGSGTQSAINAAIFGFPCSSSYTSPADDSFTSATLGSTIPAAAGSYIVIENSSSGAVLTCLDNVQAGTMANAVGKQAIDVTSGALVALGAPNSVVLPVGGIGIGVLGFDKVPGASDTVNQVAINGVAPTLANAVTGAFDIMVENSFQIRAAATVAGSGAALAGLSANGAPAAVVAGTTSIPKLVSPALDFYNIFVASAGNPVTLGTAGHVVPGVAALTENGNVAPATFTASNPVMRVGNGGNTCTPLYQMQ